ncbi:TetR/AcrR family transcriptional regulator [Hyphomicrobium sulfonivorans]|uniref:Transcriptional regulator n=1 Tax=Hyphomicrobium sulfonivorans TaxID=121290 RepID=A0A109B8P5_HYPSL|nr:TetR/AcrR family transcriptional regulator [Hyphomicrobium sulfonivorans]KWT64241.1 Transcriptional regulator [Hyphomicrobium sulfonivorans]MBI1649899.1 TetR/AcrR family transcriptional regulator [Hyphomicrobium sulfonivorans]NSL72817.1 TetR/AcrR family transcriptional regulator [Hyphomicrobium sulfonivorans]
MGRRSIHTQEELRELIIAATTSIIDEAGIDGLSAREIAKHIGYSPGTLYNMFENLDDLLLIIEARLLDDLRQQLIEAAQNAPAHERLPRLAATYFEFTQNHPKRWSLLIEHRIPGNHPVPDWYEDKISSLLQPFEDVLDPILDADTSPETRRQHARTIWAGIHGLTSLSTANKLATITNHSGQVLIDDLVMTYLAGLQRSTSHGVSTAPQKEKR